MRKTIAAAAIALGLAVSGAVAATPAAADPDPTRACKNYFRNTDKVTKREHELEVLAAQNGQNVEEYCAAHAA